MTHKYKQTQTTQTLWHTIKKTCTSYAVQHCNTNIHLLFYVFVVNQNQALSKLLWICCTEQICKDTKLVVYKPTAYTFIKTLSYRHYRSNNWYCS